MLNKYTLSLLYIIFWIIPLTGLFGLVSVYLAGLVQGINRWFLMGDNVAALGIILSPCVAPLVGSIFFVKMLKKHLNSNIVNSLWKWSVLSSLSAIVIIDTIINFLDPLWFGLGFVYFGPTCLFGVLYIYIYKVIYNKRLKVK